MARLYEYQGKQLLMASKVPIPQGEVTSTPQEAKKIAEKIEADFRRKKEY